MRGACLALVVICYISSVASTDDKTIQNVHLSITGNNTVMVVSYKTADESASVVQIGTQSGKYTRTVNGGPATNYDIYAGYNHNVVVDGLKPGTQYFYIAGDPTYALSGEFNFTTQEASGTGFVVGVYGDLGTEHAENTTKYVNQLVTSGGADWILHMGDISYANDRPWEYETAWDEWFTAMEPAMAHAPYMVCPGNHESWCRNPLCAVQTANFTTYKYKFSMMGGNESGTNTNMFYSFDYYNVHFTVLSTESDYPGSPIDLVAKDDKAYEQVNWLEADLKAAAANRDNVPWIVVTGHRPVYSGADDNSKNNVPVGQCSILQQWLEPLFNKYGVDLYLSGHAHSYERTFPVYNNEVTSYNYTNPSSTVYIVAGGAGNAEGLDAITSMTWHAAGDDTSYGYGVLTVTNDTSLTWDYHSSDNNAIVDSFTLTKPPLTTVSPKEKSIPIL